MVLVQEEIARKIGCILPLSRTAAVCSVLPTQHQPTVIYPPRVPTLTRSLTHKLRTSHPSLTLLYWSLSGHGQPVWSNTSLSTHIVLFSLPRSVALGQGLRSSLVFPMCSFIKKRNRRANNIFWGLWLFIFRWARKTLFISLSQKLIRKREWGVSKMFILYLFIQSRALISGWLIAPGLFTQWQSYVPDINIH